MKKPVIIFLSVLTVLFFSACNNNYPTPLPVTDIAFEPELSTKSISLASDGTYQLKAKAKPDNATNTKLTYTSDNPTVASVNDKGIVTAHNAGKAKITIKAANGILKEITVTVGSIKENTITEGPISVTDISLVPDEDTVSLVKGSSRQLKAQVKPDSATDKNLTFSSSTKGIVSVTAEGLITAHELGDAVITIQAANNVSKALKVTVTAAPVAVTEIVFDPALPGDPLPLSVGGTCPLYAKAQPENATDKRLSYISSNAAVASVNEEGLISAHSIGNAKIKVKAADGVSTEVTITVTAAHIPVTSIILSPDETGISLVKGATRQINAHVEPKNASDQGLAYASDNATVASVDANGLISTHSVGSANITITAADGVSKTVKLTVTAAPVPVASIEFEEQSADPVEMVIGDTLVIKATAKPDNATEKELIYTADNDNVYFSERDTVRALKDGSVTITVTSKSRPTVSKTITLEIKKKPEIRYEAVQAIQPESAGGICTFTIKTVNGKLDYEPRFTSNNIPWITGSPTISSRTDSDQDTISFTCLENKSVRDRRAYIRFWDKTANSYVKNAEGKDLTVNIIQKRNDDPALIHYKWVKGINAPTADQKETMPIIHNSNPTGNYYEQPYVFKWNETTDTNFYNARKLSKLRKNGFPNDYFVIEGIDNKKKQGTDLSQCWAKTAANMLHWWFEQNKAYIDDYTQKAAIEEWKRPLYKHDYIRGLTDKDEGKKSDIANIFRVYTHDKSYGGYIEDGLTWYLYERDGQKTLGSIYPGLFNDVFTFDTRPINTERCETKKEFERIMNEAFDNGRAIGLFWKGNKGRLYQHAVTCWGAAYDGEDNIICLYIAESNLTEAALYPYGVHYRGNIYDEPDENRTYMYNYYLSKLEDIYIDSITTLDLGEEQWRDWLRKH